MKHTHENHVKTRIRKSRHFRRALIETLEDRRLLFTDSVHALINGSTGAAPTNSLAGLSDNVLTQISSRGNELNSLSDAEAQQPENHFYGSEFSTSAARINERYRAAVLAANPANFVAAEQKQIALQEIADNFGKILHAAQDFYAHSNWVDLIRAGYVAQDSIVEAGLSYWSDFTPFTQVSDLTTTHSALTYHGVLTGEVPAGLFEVEDATPRTPYGIATAIGKQVESGNRTAWVEVEDKRFGLLVSGTFALEADHTPNNAAFFDSELNKNTIQSDPTSAHAQAVELAKAQTKHELVRLMQLVTDRWGTNQHLIDAWVGSEASDQEAFDALLQQVMDNANSLQKLQQEIEFGRVNYVTVVTHGFQPTNGGGDSLVQLAQAIHHRSGGWLIDYDVPAEGQSGYFQLHHLDSKRVQPAWRFGMRELLSQ